MSEKNCVCVICNEGATSSKRLINNPDMVDELVSYCKVRLSLGETGIKQLTDHLVGLSESECKLVYYHSEFQKTIVNKSMIE